MERFFGYSRYLATGEPVPGATIEVFDEGTLTPSSIFSDDLPTPTAKANPFTAGSDGFFFFYAEDGHYDVRISGGPLSNPIPTPYTWADILFGFGDAFFKGTKVWNPGNLPQGTSIGTTVTVTGAIPGQPCLASLSTLTQDNVQLSAYVTAPDTVWVLLVYPTLPLGPGDITIPQGNLNVIVFNFSFT